MKSIILEIMTETDLKPGPLANATERMITEMLKTEQPEHEAPAVVVTAYSEVE